MFHKSTSHKDGHRSRCSECRRLDAISSRDSNGDDIRSRDRIRKSIKTFPTYKSGSNKSRAQGVSYYQIKTGKIKRLPCEVCGSEVNIVGHHDDYLKPTDLRFMCKRHHRIWHHENGKGKNPLTK